MRSCVSHGHALRISWRRRKSAQHAEGALQKSSKSFVPNGGGGGDEEEGGRCIQSSLQRPRLCINSSPRWCMCLLFCVWFRFVSLSCAMQIWQQAASRAVLCTSARHFSAPHSNQPLAFSCRDMRWPRNTIIASCDCDRFANCCKSVTEKQHA